MDQMRADGNMINEGLGTARAIEERGCRGFGTGPQHHGDWEQAHGHRPARWRLQSRPNWEQRLPSCRCKGEVAPEPAPGMTGGN